MIDVEPFSHQIWLAGHLAERKLAIAGGPNVRLTTNDGKPVVITELDQPEYGRRIDVSRGSNAAGDLVTSSTVVLEPIEGSELAAINPSRTVDQAQAMIDDLRSAK